MWAKLTASCKRSSTISDVLKAVKGILDGGEDGQHLDKLVAHPNFNLIKTLTTIGEANVHYVLDGVEDLTQLQLCQKLVLAVNAFIVDKAKCLICDRYYDLDFEVATPVRRCQECSRPSHSICTLNLYLPKGFYWKCPDCDLNRDSKKLNVILQRLKERLGVNRPVKDEPAQDIQETNNSGDDFFPDSVKEDDDEDSEEDFDEDDDDDEEEEEEGEVCFPQRGFLCDLCQFATFDEADFEAHVEAEESRGSFVQESISGPGLSKTCLKCGEAFETWPKMYEHVTKYHSRPSDFPSFGDMEWKFLMSNQGSPKRSCGYCGVQFDSIKEWISHMKTSIEDDGKLHEITVGLEDIKEDHELKCAECSPEQSFKNYEAFKIHMSTFHWRNKRFLCAFCTFDGISAKDLNNHITLEHEGNFNKCTMCDFETWAHSVLRRHINVKHKKIRSFGCKHCPFTAMARSTLLSHINREHAQEPEQEPLEVVIKTDKNMFKCCFCTYKTTSKKSFQEHFDDAHDGNRTQCLECEFKAPVISHLRRHIDSVHRGLKKFPCDACNHRATTKQGLERHVRVRHLNLKDLKCPHCEYKTSAPDALRSHARKYHDIDEPDNLKKEPKKRIYFGNRTPIPMVCRLCGEGAPTTNKLAVHFSECHPYEKPFWCHECNIGYETYYGIQNHNRKDHSEERHLCPVCGYSTHGPQYLKRHYRRKHPNMFEALNAQQKSENPSSEDKISADEKMKVALELKGLTDEQISDKVKALILLSDDGVWTCAKCDRRFDGKPKRALYSHIRERHFHMRHFKCKECNFLSYNRAEIQEHKEKHKADKPIHQCDLCGFICDNSTGLIRHKRGRFCQNGHLPRRKRDREKMAKRMAMAYQPPSSEVDHHQSTIPNLNRRVNQDEDSGPAPTSPHNRFPYGAINGGNQHPAMY